MRFRFYFQERGTHTHVRLFGAPDEPWSTFALVGVLVYRNDEWAAFRSDTEQSKFEFVQEDEHV